MRDNGMTTGRVIELRDGQLIVSRADEAGCIVFANTDFIEISGFSEAELLGQPHNIIRHPDMPAAVFADMWRDIKAGRPWVGMLKNRCKNGDAYWVEAHVSPIWEGDRLAGYLSMRRKASPEQVQAAETLYAELRDGAGSGPIFAHGSAHGRGPFARLRRAIRRASLGSKLVLASLLAAIVILGITTFLLATHITRSLDVPAERQSRRAGAGLRQRVGVYCDV
jgi:PAS domain S-box-containing protein